MKKQRVIRVKRTPIRKKEKAEQPIPFTIPQFDRRLFINGDNAGSDAYVVAAIDVVKNIFTYGDEHSDYHFTIRDCNDKATIHGNLYNVADAFRAIERLRVIHKVLCELINKIDSGIDTYRKRLVKD